MSRLFTSGSQSIGASASVLPMISFRIDWFDLLAVQGTQESSPTPWFKSINSLMLSLLYGPTLTSIHDYWENHSFDWMDLCWQSDVKVLSLPFFFFFTIICIYFLWPLFPGHKFLFLLFLLGYLFLLCNLLFWFRNNLFFFSKDHLNVAGRAHVGVDRL